MAHWVVYNSEENIIETHMTGKANLAELQAMAAEMVQLALKENCRRTLTDMREVEVTLSTSEYYFFQQPYSIR